MKRTGPSGRTDQTLRWFAKALPYFYFHSCNLGQMGASVRRSPQRFSGRFSLILTPFLNIARSHFAKYLRRLRQDLTSFLYSFLGRSKSQIMLREVTLRSGRNGRSWRHRASDWLVSLWRRCPVVGHCFIGDTTDVRKAEKEIASLTVDEIEVYAESVRALADTVGPIWSQLQE